MAKTRKTKAVSSTTPADLYEEFIAGKKLRAEQTGFECGPLTREGAECQLFDWQQYVARIALKAGKFALFEDCVAGDTIIHSPDGDIRMDALYASGKEIRVYANSGFGVEIITASAPWSKGEADMFQVTTDTGRTIRATGRHQFLCGGEWKKLSSLTVGAEIQVCDVSRLRSNLDNGPSDQRQDARHSMQKAGGSTEHYSACPRRDGGQLPPLSGSDRSFPPSRVDAPEHIPSRELAGDLAEAGIGSRPRLCIGHPSMMDYLTPSRTYCEAAALVLVASSAPIRRFCGDLSNSQYPEHASQRHGGYEFEARSSESMSMDDLFSYSETVTAISYIGKERFFDIHVPRLHNYLANGFWSHNCGLGKSAQQVIWADEAQKHTGKPVLILCPLAVAAQTVEEGKKFGVEVIHVREPEEVKDTGIYITNYDRLEKFLGIISKFAGVVLDESSLLKSFTGKTRIMLTEVFKEAPYRLCCTATPAPNDYAELGQHAEFLGVMTSGQMLATWFINDTSDTGTWRLKKHARPDFWRWVGTWAACISKPSDIGYSDEGYNLPPIELHNHSIAVDEVTGAPEGELFRATTVSATNLHKEARFSIAERCNQAVNIAIAENTPCLIWCELNDESEMLATKLKASLGNNDEDFVELRGSLTPITKERRLGMFASGDVKYMISKPELGGYGMNFQHCCRQIFVGQSWSMEDQYQAMRRSYRFGQSNPVHIHFITPSTLGDVRVRVREKFAAHETMKLEMKEAAKQLTATKDEGIDTENIPHLSGGRWNIYNGDCVAVARKHIADDSVGLSIFSPPFSDLFTYSARSEDMGNSKDMAEFMQHFRFQIAELHRVTMPGREVAVHCGDLLSTKWKHGEIQLQDFSGLISQEFRAAGLLFHSRITIWKSPVTEMQRTKAHGLLYKTLRKDSSNSRVGMPDYLMVFRKKGVNPNPVTHAESDFSLAEWQEIASPVWMTIEQGNVLNRKGSKETGDERHICPLQLDVIERAVKLWSNPGDLVYSPFCGIGSEGYQAIKMQRRFVGSELKASYFKDAALWLTQAESERELFALDGATSVAEMPRTAPADQLMADAAVLSGDLF